MHLRTLFLLFALIFSASTAWGFNPKVKAIGLNAVYGSIGGAILGVSSLAFGAKGRVVAKGASLGLYFGLVFGAYVVITHGRGYGLDDSGEGGYAPSGNTNIYDGGGDAFRFKSDGFDIENHYYDSHPLKDPGERPNFYLRFFQYQF